MKIQCNACGAAEASVLCCADEAALCAVCDEEVHAANKLAGKHQRVPLLAADPAAAAPPVPKCDICQEAAGYFFCLEDRALLCRDCDVAIHTVNQYVSVHQRFLLTGVQVGLDPADPVPPIADKQLHATDGSVDPPLKHLPNSKVLFSGESSATIPTQNRINGDFARKNSFPNARTGSVNWTVNNNIRSGEPLSNYMSEESPSLLLSNEANAAFSNQTSRDGSLAYNLPFSGGDSLLNWPVDEFFGNSEYTPNFGFPEHSSSKGDNAAKLGSAGGSPQYRLGEGLDAEELLGQVPGLDGDSGRVPESSWTVPEVPSPPTASGLYWQGSLQYSAYGNTMFVPEVSPLQNSRDNFTISVSLKRRRQQF